MAINYELLNKGGISLGTNFELLSEKPLDSRLVVPSLSGLQNYIDNAAAYEGMIVFDQTTKKTYQVQTIDGVLSYREFGINEDELKALIAAETTAAMEFKGAATALPENPAKGDMYKVTEPFKVGEVDVKVGDSIVYDGTEWFIIPSGDDIEDTWRPVTGVDNDASLTFADGEKTVAAVAENGTIKINHAKTAAPADVTAEGDEKTRTYLTAVITDDYGHVTGYKTATENVEDTNTEYTFKSQVESSNVYFNVTPDTEGATEQTIYVDAYNKSEADNKFVAKEEGKSLISDDEIARLATLKNYDDTQVKADIAKKADEEVMTTELGKKVDKVEGKDLIATSEIERLATLKNYDDTALAGRVTTAESKITSLETESAKHALKTELQTVDAKFNDYTKTADLPTDLDDFTNNAGYAKTADVNTKLEKKADTAQVATDIANAIKPLATTEALTGVDAKFAQYTNTTDMNAKFDLKADKSVVDAMYTNDAIDTAVQGAKDYAKGLVDAIPAQTDYTVTITETTDGLANHIAKKYTFTQNGAEIRTINLAKELVVTSGSVKEVTTADTPYTGAVVGDKYIELVIANQATPIYVPAKDLVDIYTAAANATEVQVAISNANEISATLVKGGVTEEKLAEGVKTKLNKTWEEVGVAAGLVEGLENGQVKTNKEAIEKLNGADTVDGSVAKSIKDAIANENLGQYAKTADLGDLAGLDTITADKVTDFETEVAKVKVAEAEKATLDGNGKPIAETYAEKATTYTKAEVDALLTWGEF